MPLNVPVPLLIAAVTDAPGTLLPKLSVTRTVTGGAITVPAVASPGCCTKTNCAAAAGEIVNAPLITEANPVLDAVRFLEPLKLMPRSLNVARPAESLVLEVVPPSVPVPLLNVIATVSPDTSLPKLSVT